MRGTIVKPVSQSSGASTRAGRADAIKAERQGRDSISRRPIALSTYLRTGFDMIGFAVELPFRWKALDLKPYLPIHTKLGYGLMLNAITDMWLLTSGTSRKNLDTNSITVVKHFIGYLNTMDDFLDDPKNKGAILRFNKGDELWERRKELFGSIGHYDASMKKSLKRAISSSTFSMLGAMAKFRKHGASDLDGALFIRENTAGEICRATAELFNIINEVPSLKAKAIEEAFWNVGMVLQVHDDIGDVGRDDKGGFCENLVLQLLNQRPDEKARLIEALANKKNCTYGMLTRHAPETFSAARALQDSYLDVIPDTGGFERIKCLIDLSVSLRGRSVALRSLIDKMDL